MVGEGAADPLDGHIPQAVLVQDEPGRLVGGDSPPRPNLGVPGIGGLYPHLGPKAQKNGGQHQDDIGEIKTVIITEHIELLLFSTSIPAIYDFPVNRL